MQLGDVEGDALVDLHAGCIKTSGLLPQQRAVYILRGDALSLAHCLQVHVWGAKLIKTRLHEAAQLYANSFS